MSKRVPELPEFSHSFAMDMLVRINDKRPLEGDKIKLEYHMAWLVYNGLVAVSEEKRQENPRIFETYMKLGRSISERRRRKRRYRNLALIGFSLLAIALALQAIFST